MKKILIAMLFAAGTSTSATAAWHEGKVDFIQTTAQGIKISLLNADGLRMTHLISATGDTEKTIIAMALTAQAATRDITLFETSGEWTSVLLKQ